MKFKFLLSLCLFAFASTASAVPIFYFDDSHNTNNYLNLSGDEIESTFNGVAVTLAGDLSNPLIYPSANYRITLRDILVGSEFASGEVESLASLASGGVFTLYSGNTKLVEARLGNAELTYNYVGTTGPQNDPVYVLRYDTADLDIIGGTYASYFAAGGFNGFLDLVFDNAHDGYMEFAGGSLFGATNHNCAVPELTSMALLGMGGVAMLKRRKKA